MTVPLNAEIEQMHRDMAIGATNELGRQIAALGVSRVSTRVPFMDKIVYIRIEVRDKSEEGGKQ